MGQQIGNYNADQDMKAKWMELANKKAEVPTITDLGMPSAAQTGFQDSRPAYDSTSWFTGQTPRGLYNGGK